MRGRGRLAAVLAAVLTALGLAVPARAGAAGSGASALTVHKSVESDRGPARLAALPDGGSVRVQAFGTVARQASDGSTLWRVTSSDLFADWHVTWDGSGVVQTPQLAWTTSQSNPLRLASVTAVGVNDLTPYAVGDLGGIPAVAVAYTVGFNVSSATTCSFCGSTFTVPGSDVHQGTFVTVLDSRDGHMLYSALDPGYVTQLAIDHGRLMVGEELGDPRPPGSFGKWGGTTLVKALAFRKSGRGLAGSRLWQYDTGAPWARIFGLRATSYGTVAFAWSDTPVGLGSPRPPDGHVVLLDSATGERRWDVRTKDYPLLLAADPSTHDVITVESADPSEGAGYRIVALGAPTGSTVRSVARAGSVPLSLAVVPATSRSRLTYAVGSLDVSVTTSADGSVSHTPRAGRVSDFDMASGHESWSQVLPEADGNVPQPDGVAAVGDTVMAGSWTDAQANGDPTGPAAPDDVIDSVTGLDARTGTVGWQHVGDVGDPVSLTAGKHTASALTLNDDLDGYRADGTLAQQAGQWGDVLSALQERVGSGAAVVAGNESGAVVAFDGRDIGSGAATPRVLWRTQMPVGAVHRLLAASDDGRPVVVAVASQGIGVIDTASGRLDTLIRTPGYLWTAVTATVRGRSAVVVPDGNAITAYSLSTASALWRHSVPSGTSLSNLVDAKGVIAGEYSTPSGSASPAMAAFGLDVDTGAQRWNAPAPSSTTAYGQLWNGVAVGQDIPGAHGRGSAFAWTTPGGSGRIDVRDIVTGALDYGNTSDAEGAHTGYLVDPALGLMAYSAWNTVAVTPDGPVTSSSGIGGEAQALVSSGGTRSLLTANGQTTAYGLDALTGTGSEPFGSDTTYEADNLVAMDLRGDGDLEAVALPPDIHAQKAVSEEMKVAVGNPPDELNPQHGVAVLSVSEGVRPHGSHRAPGPSGEMTATGVPDVPPNQAKQGLVKPQLTARRLAAAPSDSAPLPYTPSDITGSLGLSGDGSGQTIAIVDSYADPTIASDVEAFSKQFGLPGVCGSGGTAPDCFTLDVHQPAGSEVDSDWQLETSLDVEWAHTMAPHARILLVQTDDGTLAGAFRAVDVATAADPAVVSMSWGVDGGFSDESYYDGHCRVRATLCVVSSGDSGHPGGYPAFNPSALAVGGTSLTLAGDGAVLSEQSWKGSGGGTSAFEPEPGYQQGVNATGRRQIPDVSFDADPDTGVAVYLTPPGSDSGSWYQVGGTSVGAPVWSGILADADQLRAAGGAGPLSEDGDAALRAIYGLAGTSALADITAGASNGACPQGCAAGPGYDTVTGLGSPRRGIDTALAAWNKAKN